jgi:hypothetical protein
LDESLVQVDVDLHERLVAETLEFVNLPGFHDEDVTGTGFTLHAIDGPPAAPGAHHCNLVIRMPMQLRRTAWRRFDEIDRRGDTGVLGPMNSCDMP